MKILLCDHPVTPDQAEQIEDKLKDLTGHEWLVVSGGRAIYDLEPLPADEAPEMGIEAV